MKASRILKFSANEKTLHDEYKASNLTVPKYGNILG